MLESFLCNVNKPNYALKKNKNKIKNSLIKVATFPFTLFFIYKLRLLIFAYSAIFLFFWTNAV